MPDTETNTIFFCIKKLTWNLCLTVSPTLLWTSSLLVMMIGRIYANYCHVTPIHRSGNKNLPNNYRPISLTSIPCKMLEHIVLNYLNKTLDVILHNRQHGFRKGLSCDTQLCSTYHDLAKHTINHWPPMLLYWISKGLLTRYLTHPLLLQKLRQIPVINPRIVDCVQDYNRQSKRW